MDVGEMDLEIGNPKRALRKKNSTPQNKKIKKCQRIEAGTKLGDPSKMVCCAVCSQEMSLLYYQSIHLLEHNFLCWLSGEEPIDLSSEYEVMRLLSRVKNKVPDVTFKCPQCTIVLKSPKGFMSHRKTCSLTNLPEICPICGIAVLNSDKEDHLKGHSSQNFNSEQIKSEKDSVCDNFVKCNYCDLTTATKSQMTIHTKNAHPEFVKLNKNIKTDQQSMTFHFNYLKNEEKLFKTLGMKVGFFTPALRMTRDQRLLNYSFEKLFPNFEVNIEEWSFKTEKECYDYLPMNTSSMKAAGNGNEWFQLNLFEHKIIRDNVAMMFCGGPVFGLAWAPSRHKQYLAVSINLSMEEYCMANTVNSGPGVVQIWSMGTISNLNNSSYEGMRLEYVICHDEGCCWGLEWCPSGCSDGTRLGLLALATSTGSIPIYSVPVSCKSESENILPLCKPKAALKLELCSNEKVTCTQIAWSKVKPHSIFGAGFSNGILAFWDLNGTSSLLRKGNTLHPFKTFQAHHAMVTGLCFSPTQQQYCISTGQDRTLKFWDLYDTTAPKSLSKRFFATGVAWLDHWMTASASIDGIYCSGDTSMTYNSIRDIAYETFSYTTSVDSSALSVATNNWINSSFLSFDNGQTVLVIGRNHTFFNGNDRNRHNKVILEPHLYDFSIDNYVPSKDQKSQYDYGNIDCNSYKEAAQRYGIDFKFDLDLSHGKDKLKGSTSNMFEIYPVQTANRVSCNPNIDGFLNFSVGYQCGIVFLSKLELVPKQQRIVDELIRD